MKTIWKCDDGAAAAEFAIIAPLLVAMLMGVVAYGGYFWTAHAVQQVANDASRAALGGLTDTERRTIVNEVTAEEIGDYAFLHGADAASRVTASATAMTVQVSYDASGSPFFALGALTPMPSSTIVRSATVRLGGY